MSAPAASLRPVARAAWLGACAGAVAAGVDAWNAATSIEARGARGELALGCAAVDFLSGVLLAVLLRTVWEVTQGLGRTLQRLWPRAPGAVTATLPLGALLAVWLAHDSETLFAGRGIASSMLATAGGVGVPVVGAVFGAALSQAVPPALDRLRQRCRALRLATLVGCLLLAALLIHAERLPQLDPYFAVRRYCELGALVSALLGLAASGRLASLPERLPARAQRALGLVPVAIATCLPLLFPSSRARLALTSRSFVASPVARGLRRVFDFDGDGYSPVLGGGDCNDFDRGIHPFTRDPPGDGVDQDCDGVDGWTAEPVDPAPAYGSLDAPAAAELRARTRGRNVLVILVDALRFDRVEGPRAAGFPHLSRLARAGVRFDQALSPASRTPLTVPVLLGGPDGEAGAPMLRAMRAAGMRTGFASVDVVNGQLELQTRARRDVEVLSVSTEGDRSLWGGGVHVATGGAITGMALRWIETQGAAPWMLWVHYFGAHQWDALDSARSLSAISDRYDVALTDDDRAVGALLDGLARRGLAERTVVVLLADHGESLGDHGWRTHGGYLYPELVHVPFVVVVPGVPPRSVASVVPTAALAPTLLDLLSIAPTGPGGAESLVPLLADASLDRTGAARPVLMHDTRQSGIAMGDRLLRFTPEENATELFAIEQLDAARADDIGGAEPETAVRLSRQLVALAPWR
jgi:hypothetical protein